MRIYNDGTAVAFETPEEFNDFKMEPSKFESLRELGFNFNPEFGELEFPQISSLAIRKQIKGEFDLRRFPNLTFLSVNEWNRKLDFLGVDNLTKLVEMYLSSFKPKDDNLIPLVKFQGVRVIEIIGTNVTSLDGLEHLRNLVRLKLEDARKLVDISSLVERTAPSEAAPFSFSLTGDKVVDWNSLTSLRNECPGIRDLGFENCRDIPSLSFLKLLPNLRSLYLYKTLVLDGNMNPGQHLLRFWHDNKRSYNLKCKDEELGWEGIDTSDVSI